MACGLFPGGKVDHTVLLQDIKYNSQGFLLYLRVIPFSLETVLETIPMRRSSLSSEITTPTRLEEASHARVSLLFSSYVTNTMSASSSYLLGTNASLHSSVQAHFTPFRNSWCKGCSTVDRSGVKSVLLNTVPPPNVEYTSSVSGNGYGLSRRTLLMGTLKSLQIRMFRLSLVHTQ